MTMVARRLAQRCSVPCAARRRSLRSTCTVRRNICVQRTVSLTRSGLHLATANHIGSIGAFGLAPELPGLPNLIGLDLGTNNILVAGARSLARSLPRCRALTALNLADNNLGHTGTAAIARALPQCAALRCVNLTNNGAGLEGACALADALPQCSSLQALVLNRNDIGSDGAAHLAPALARMPALSYLGLGQCMLGDDGLRCVADELTEGPLGGGVSFLDVSNNGLTAASGRTLGNLLPLMDGLACLRVGRNMLGDTGVVSMCGAMPHCPDLEELGLDANDCSSVAAQALAGVLPRCQELRRLHLGSNRINDDGAVALASVLDTCKALEHLVLTDCPVSQAGRDVLHKRLARATRPTIVMLTAENLHGPRTNANVTVWYPRQEPPPPPDGAENGVQGAGFDFVDEERRRAVIAGVVDLPYVERLDPLDDLMDDALSESDCDSDARPDVGRSSDSSSGSEVLTRAKAKAKSTVTAQGTRGRRARLEAARIARRKQQREVLRAQIQVQRRGVRKRCKVRALAGRRRSGWLMAPHWCPLVTPRACWCVPYHLQESIMVVEVAAAWQELKRVQGLCDTRPHAVNRIEPVSVALRRRADGCNADVGLRLCRMARRCCLAQRC